MKKKILFKCRCNESKEGRCDPKGYLIVKSGSNCFLFKKQKDAEAFSNY